MKLSNLVRSSSFRLALIYLALFASSVLILLAFIYWSTVTFTANQMDETIQSDVTGLSEQYRLRGVNGVIASIGDRLQRDPDSSSVYLLTTPDFIPMTGNLSSWPKVKTTTQGWLNFQFKDPRSSRDFYARARPFVLQGGFNLLVGRDTRDLNEIQQLLKRAILWGLLITLGLGLLGAGIMSRSIMSRIELINQNSRDIIAGNLSQRIPLSGGNDDIDQLAKNLNHMLDEIERLMDGIRQVSDNIAHDLRTPLTRMRNRLEQLQTNFKINSPEFNAAQDSMNDADQLLKIFAALLRIARIEAGGHPVNFSSVNLNGLVTDAVELYEALAEDNEIEIILKKNDEAIIEGDRDFLFQALINLLDNAIKYTPTKGKITIFLEKNQQYIELMITDTGPGIPEKEYKNIGQRFYRLEASRGMPGSGLGLSLVNAVVHLHKGTLLFAGNNPGLITQLRFDQKIEKL
jgi:signal transduction histidine kinase